MKTDHVYQYNSSSLCNVIGRMERDIDLSSLLPTVLVNRPVWKLYRFLLAKPRTWLARRMKESPPLLSSAAIPKQVSLTNHKTMCS